jgi:hypothetical protein
MTDQTMSPLRRRMIEDMTIRKFARYAPTSRDRRASIRHDEGANGATHFLTKTLPKVAAKLALSALAYNLTRVMNLLGIKPLIALIAA